MDKKETSWKPFLKKNLQVANWAQKPLRNHHDKVRQSQVNTNNLLDINSHYIEKYLFFKLQNIMRRAQQNVCIRYREAPKRCFYFSNMIFCCWNENFQNKTTISFLTACNYFVKVNPQKTWSGHHAIFPKCLMPRAAVKYTEKETCHRTMWQFW